MIRAILRITILKSLEQGVVIFEVRERRFDFGSKWARGNTQSKEVLWFNILKRKCIFFSMMELMFEKMNGFHLRRVILHLKKSLMRLAFSVAFSKSHRENFKIACFVAFSV